MQSISTYHQISTHLPTHCIRCTYLDALRKLLDCNAASRRLVTEPLLVLSVHLLEVFHIGQVDLANRVSSNRSTINHISTQTYTAANDFAYLTASLLENLADVRATLLRRRSDAFLNQSARGIRWDLA
jgi:hypothetical protein